MKNIVFLDYDTLPDEIELKEINSPSNLICYPKTSASEIRDRVRDANIIITNKVKISRNIINASVNLELIAIAATGTDIIDLQACREKGISVVNIRNYATETVPEHTFALMLNLRRNITAYQQAVQHGRWQQSGQFCFFDYQIKNLSGARLGIIGDGVLGKRVAEIAKCFDMEILFASHYASQGPDDLYADFDEVIINSDIITLHCPLLESTKNMISAREFKMMKPSALLINTARGGLVNETDLYNAITQGEIAGAAFDVAVNEPPEPDDLILKMTNLPNFILTPHISWASIEAIQSLADMLIDNINAYLSGVPENVVV
ncbi:TPA: D-2-hydroxyacid dehydrogenase [Klebsiella quasipneumoniae subsp. quasipneumoniae]|nr:D-2-hydroxyacid dehydrogenase [Klebsiella quasipneumoniae subsp. quasipneumoniae]